MPVKTGKSALAAKLGNKLKQAHEAHKNDETKLSGGGDLPEGIDAGIAQIVDCKFDTYKSGDNVGEYYFYARAIVVEPKEIRGIPIEGLATQLGPEPICDTPSRSRKTTEDHLAWVLNEFRKLGVDTKAISADDYETVAAGIKEAAPYIRFRTWKGEATTEFPNPRVNHDWRGITNYNGQATEGIADSTSAETFDPEGDHEADTAPEGEEGGEDLEALVAQADGGDTAAQQRITELCESVGVNAETAESWEAAIASYQEASGSETSTESEAEEFKPTLREMHFYRPNDPKTKKPVKKAIECEVTAVNESKKTVNLKNMTDGKTVYKDIPWDKLEQGA